MPMNHSFSTCSPRKKKSKSQKTRSPAKGDGKAGSGPNFKSKEYISEEESSSGEKFYRVPTRTGVISINNQLPLVNL